MEWDLQQGELEEMAPAQSLQRPNGVLIAVTQTYLGLVTVHISTYLFQACFPTFCHLLVHSSTPFLEYRLCPYQTQDFLPSNINAFTSN